VLIRRGRGSAILQKEGGGEVEEMREDDAEEKEGRGATELANGDGYKENGGSIELNDL